MDLCGMAGRGASAVTRLLALALLLAALLALARRERPVTVREGWQFVEPWGDV